jgi:hypothetical protein
MEHEFLHDPVKIRIVDIKSGEWEQSYVFVGSVPENIKKELYKVEKDINKDNSVLKKYYGSGWRSKLGIADIKKGGNIVGGNSNILSIVGGQDYEFEIDDDILDDLDFNLSNEQINNETKIEQSNKNQNKSDLHDDSIDVSNQDDTAENNIQKGEAGIQKGELDLQKNIIEITEEDIQKNINNDNLILEDALENPKIQHKGGIKFITDINVYSVDNILELKHKIYLSIGIPIYRQHLWFKYKDKSYPASYSLLMNNNIQNINIENLVNTYKEKNAEFIEDIPIDIEYYKNKDMIKIIAEDTFTILDNIYYKYGTNEFYITDLNDIIDSRTLYDKISKDKYQIELIYYGFVCLYFPMITLTVFQDYIKNEKNIKQIYPELLPDKNNLIKKYNLQTDITEQAYETEDKEINKNLYSSITQTTVSINNYNQDIEYVIAIRNLFDIIELNNTITYCKANVLYENNNLMLKKSYMNEKEPRDIIPINSVLIKIKINPDTNENMRLIIFKNGNYVIKTDWREENHMDFKKITRVVSEKINPIIKIINKMDEYVKYNQILLLEVNEKNITFTETSISFYYDVDVTEARFNLIKNILEDYKKAGIIVSKENVSLGYEFFFKKGMHKYDSSRLEKVINIDNYYDYLSNGVIYQKWETIFERTRLLQILNISSKLKINISGIRNDTEMNIFYLYLKGMLLTYNEQAKKIKLISDELMRSKSKKALKNLKYQDPLLYDFKKIYNTNIVYSRKCQKQYQPIILTDEEYNKLSKDKKDKAIKYWNFTKEKPVWYSCPNSKYPYVKFITKMHPKDFCVPCCKKIEMSYKVNKKKQEIHNICMNQHIYTGEKVNLTKGSHYIASYGKNIEIGRISRLPENTLEPLFFDTYSPEGGIDQECTTADGYYLLGIEQNTIHINDIGMLFCIAHSINMQIDAFLEEASKRIKKNPDKFRVLLDGDSGLYFNSNNELSEAVFSLNKESDLLPNNYYSVPWNELFMSIAYYHFGINVILFIDKQKEMIELVLPKGLKDPDEMFPDTHKNLIVLNRLNKYNPVYLFNTEIYKRTSIIDTRLFLNESGISAILKAVVRKSFYNQNYDKIKNNIDLTVLKDFAKDNNITINKYYINYNNLCYGIVLSYKNKDIYMPVYESHYPLQKNINLVFTPYNGEYSANIELLDNIFKIFNKWNEKISIQNKLEGINIYPNLEIQHWLKVQNDIIGLSINNINYFIKSISEKEAIKYKNKPVQILLYHPYKINQLINMVKNGNIKAGVNAELTNKTEKSMYEHYLYNIFLLHIIKILNKERDKVIRKKINTIIIKTNFDKDMSEVRDFIKSIKDDEDKIKLKNIISKYLIDHHDKKKLLDDIDNSYFNFDKLILEKFKTMPIKKVKIDLYALSKQFVKIGSIPKKFKFPNILVTCKGKEVDYCSDNKLIIEKNKLDEIIDILSHDIINPTKWKWLFNSIFIEKYVQYFKFIARKNESIEVEFLNI